MMQRPKISVTIPSFKAQFLKECIDSILAQTYNNFELVIVNDASPEDLDEIVSKYDDHRIRYYKNDVGFGAKNVVGNWNKCLEYAEGDYVICMGDDDRLLPNCLEEYAKLIEKNPGLGVYHGWTEAIDENGEISNIFLPMPEKEDVYSLIYSRLSGRPQFIGDFLYDTKLLKKSGGFYNLPYAWGSDNVSSFRAAVGKGIAHTQVPVFQYRSNRQSISSSSHNREKMETTALQFQWIETFLQQKSSGEKTISELLRKQCLKQLPQFFRKNVKYYMLQDMKSGSKISSLFYWSKQCGKYQYPFKLVLRMLAKSIL